MAEARNPTATEQQAGTSPAGPVRTWTMTFAISFALLVAMYGLAYLNDAHSEPRAASQAPISAPNR